MSEMSNRLPVETNHVNGNERTMSRYEMMNCHNQVQYHHDSNNHSISNNLHRSHHSAAATDQIHTNNNVNECTVREQDRFMPIANVIRIMRKILPPHAKISDDAKETIQECVSEYISFITGEANERCQREQRKTITAEDVLWAMGKLGFDNYIEPLSLYLHRYRELEGDRGSLMREPFLKINRPTAMDQYARFGVRPAFHIRPPHPHPHPCPHPHPHLHPLPLPHPHPPPPPHPGYFGAPSLSSTTVRGYFKETSGTAFDDDSQHIQPPLIGSGPSSSFSATTFEPYAQQYD